MRTGIVAARPENKQNFVLLTVAYQVPLTFQDATVHIRQIPANLAHPQARGHPLDPGVLVFPRSQVDNEQHEKSLQAPPVHTSIAKRPRRL
jgi:hypothetical protein